MSYARLSDSTWTPQNIPMKNLNGMDVTNIHDMSHGSSNAHENLNFDDRKQAVADSKTKYIVWSALLLTLPMLLLTIALLALIFGYQVKSSQAPFPGLIGNSTDSIVAGAFYVDLPATFVIFVSSWMSSLAPILVGLAISLAIYPISDQFLADSMQSNGDRLLTPYQLAIALKFISGAVWGGLLDLANYWIGKRAQIQGKTLRSLTWATVSLVFLSLVVIGADTWLHIVTKTVPFIQLTALVAGDTNYSFSLLSPNCTSTENSFSALAEANITCTIDPYAVILQDGVTAIQTLNDQSKTISIYNDGPDSTLVYLGVASAQRDDRYDFTANTLGMRATCRPITQDCGLGGKANTSDAWAFNCSSGTFSGNLLGAVTADQFQQAYFYDFSSGNMSQGSTSNPYEYTVAFSTQTAAKLPNTMENDPEVFLQSSTGYLGAVLLCNVTAYNIEYDMVNGNVSRMVATPSNMSTVNIFTPGLMQTQYGWSALQSDLQLAGIVATNAQDLADQYALAYSKVALSIGAGSVVHSPVLHAQRRNTILVAKVPKAPLLLLVIINLIFVCLGAVLTFMALRSSHHAFQVQMRLSISGIVAILFGSKRANQAAEDHEYLFDEFWENGRGNRIGVQITNENECLLGLVRGTGGNAKHVAGQGYQ